VSIVIASLTIVLIWSTTPLAIQWSTTDAGFLFGITSRMLIGTLICLAILLVKRQKLPLNRDAIIVYLCAASGIYGSMLFVYWGASYIPSGMIAVVFGLSPLITVILAKPLLNEPSVSFYQLIGLALALVGLILTSQTSLKGYHYFGFGIVLVVISVSLHSLSSVLTKRYNKQHCALVVTSGGLLIASSMLCVTWLIFDGKLPNTLPDYTLGSILYLGIVATGAGFMLYFYVLTKVSPVKLALLTLITPLTAIAIGVIFNNETLTVEIVTGTALIMTGLILNLIRKKDPSMNDVEEEYIISDTISIENDSDITEKAA